MSADVAKTRVMTKPKRFGKMTCLKSEWIDEYKRLHREVWPGVTATISACNMTNFSIFLRKMPDQKHYLFLYFEYVGKDQKADWDKMAACPITQEWWKITNPMFEPLTGSTELWSDWDEAYHWD